jgi:glyoxylase-like metal-dependent hydrolase (beta-lactamase superfamily II)
MRNHVLAAAFGFALTAIVAGAGVHGAAAADEVHVLPIQGNVSMIVSAGGNVTVQIGEQGVLVVDTSVAEMSDGVVAAIRRLTDKPIRFIVNTHAHPDHTGGNASIARAGATVSGGTIGAAFTPSGASIIAHENVLARMSAPTGSQAPTPADAWPTNTYFGDRKELFFNGEAIEILHQPAAHTDGDSLVFFRRSDVLSAGDLFVTSGYPVVDTKWGGTIQGVIDGLNRILVLTVPKDKQEGGTYVVPGHGRLCDEADVLEFRDMVTIVRDRIKDMMSRGMTLEQVKAARPTLDYDGRYGSKTGAWTTEMFIEAVYRNLGGT